MSKRFGRNQKRKLTMQVVDQQAELNKINIRNTQLSRQYGESEAALREVERVIGHHFIALSPRMKGADVPVGGMLELIPPMHMSVSHSMRSVPELVQLNLQRLQAVHFKPLLDRLRGDIHCRFITSKGEVRYAITPREARSINVNQLAEEIGYLVANNREFQELLR